MNLSLFPLYLILPGWITALVLLRVLRNWQEAQQDAQPVPVTVPVESEG